MMLLYSDPDIDSTWLIIVAYLILSYCNALVAKEKGRNGTTWFLFSILISPIFAILVLIALGNSNEQRIKHIKEDEIIRREIREEEERKRKELKEHREGE